jgi:hypothetical protein
VFVEVLGLGVEFLSTSNFHPINIPDGYVIEWVTQSLDVRIRGRREDLDHITPMSIRVVTDLRDYGAGPHRIPSRIHVEGIDGDVGAVGDYWVTLRIVPDTD